MLSLVPLPSNRGFGASSVTEPTPEQRAAPRLPASAVPAITGLRIPSQGVALLINISETGLLVECSDRLTPGGKITVIAEGTFRPATLRGRVTRSSVAALGTDGRLRYHVGVVFDSRITLVGESADPPPAVPPESIVKNRW